VPGARALIAGAGFKRSKRCIAAFINSMFCFYWDVVHDWDLGQISRRGGHYLLRDRLFYQLNFLSATSTKPAKSPMETSPSLLSPPGSVSPTSPKMPESNGTSTLYYVVVVVNFLLRCLWLLRLLVFYHMQSSYTTVFIFQLLEIFRRWIWIFFRFEREWLRTGGLVDLDMAELKDSYHHVND
jgi:hypothetical protein